MHLVTLTVYNSWSAATNQPSLVHLSPAHRPPAVSFFSLSSCTMYSPHFRPHTTLYLRTPCRCPDLHERCALTPTLTTQTPQTVQVRRGSSMRTRHGLVRVQGNARQQREIGNGGGNGALGLVLDRHVRVAPGSCWCTSRHSLWSSESDGLSESSLLTINNVGTKQCVFWWERRLSEALRFVM